MKLRYKVFGEGRPVIILHGLFGMLDNWQQFAKRLAYRRRVYIPDLRNHGKSPHSDIFNYDVLSKDLIQFINENGIKSPSLIGHSMGGKLALSFSSKHQSIVDKVIVIDIGIKKYPPKHTTILKALGSLDLKTFNSRNQIDDALSEWIPALRVRQFLLKNITRDQNSYSWKMNISAITNNYLKIIDRINFPKTLNNQVLFIKGSNSDYIIESDKKDILSYIPDAKFVTIPDCGHWVHAEQPDRLLDVIERELSRLD